MQTETLVLTSLNHGFQFFAVRSGLFDFWDKGRPVTVTIKALGGQKTGPDWTFKHYQLGYFGFGNKD